MLEIIKVVLLISVISEAAGQLGPWHEDTCEFVKDISDRVNEKAKREVKAGNLVLNGCPENYTVYALAIAFLEREPTKGVVIIWVRDESGNNIGGFYLSFSKFRRRVKLLDRKPYSLTLHGTGTVDLSLDVVKVMDDGKEFGKTYRWVEDKEAKRKPKLENWKCSCTDKPNNGPKKDLRNRFEKFLGVPPYDETPGKGQGLG